jgi:branched-chain amino acid transport system permease protein
MQFAVSYFIYKGMITRYLEKEEILLTGLLLVALIVEQGANYLYPIQAGVFLDTTLVEGTYQMGVTVISSQLLAGSIIALLLTALFVLFFVKTRLGLAVRALSQDIRSSRIVGINVQALYVFTMMFVLVPVIIGVLIVAPIWTLEPGMGWMYMTIAILVSVLGGLGNIRGTIMASYLIGITHAVMCFVVGEPRFMTLSALVLVLVILVLRPQGLTRSEALW